MALSKIRSESVDLTDDYAFTGTVSGAGGTSVAIIIDEKTQGTSGGSAGSTTAYVTRDLNTELADPDGIVSIASNQFTLGAGKYLIDFSAPARDTHGHRARLRDITNTATIALGSNCTTDANDNVVTNSAGTGYVDISSSTTYEIQHKVAADLGSSTFGTAINFSGETEVYTIVKILKVG